MPHSSSTQPIATASVLDYPVFLGSLEEALNHTWQASEAGLQPQIVTINPEMMMAGDATQAFGNILKHAFLALPDGAGVVWALKKQGVQQTRLPGIEFADALVALCAKYHAPVAYLGATQAVLEKAIEQQKERHVGLNVCFTHHGFIPTEAAMEEVIQTMVEANPRLVLVALGVPKQEYWIHTHKHRFAKETIFVGVGGSLDVWSGTLQRAPQWMQALSLEWLWRFSLQPWRLKRSFPPLTRFVWRVLLG
jgi:N-acetylglucosaminyldiphosphoundecaprenol N-acetyl-beta-D-mannosaminyltransferase